MIVHVLHILSNLREQAIYQIYDKMWKKGVACHTPITQKNTELFLWVQSLNWQPFLDHKLQFGCINQYTIVSNPAKNHKQTNFSCYEDDNKRQDK
jgi:hypothetical protein